MFSVLISLFDIGKNLMVNYILGWSYYYHDSAAALIINREKIALAQEERFSRKNNHTDLT